MKLIPIWPMKAVSIKDAIGSAVKASAAGKAILRISWPSSSNLKTDLRKGKKKIRRRRRTNYTFGRSAEKY